MKSIKIKSLSNVLVIVLIITACTTNNEPGEYRLNKIVLPGSDGFKILYETSDIVFDDYLPAIDVKSKTWISSGATFRKLFSKLDNSIEIQSVVLYSLDTLDTSSISGVGIYYYSYTKNNYYFELYKYNVVIGKYEKKFSYLSHDLLMRDLLYILDDKFAGSKMDMFLLKNFKQKETKNKYSDLSLKHRVKTLEIMSKSPQSTLNRMVKGVRKEFVACGYVGNCQTGSGVCKPLLFYCAPEPSCPMMKVEDMVKTIKVKNASYLLSNVLLDNKYYYFRNNYLIKTSLGREYIGLYYASSQHFADVLDVKILLSILETFPTVNKAIDNYIDNNYEGIIIKK